MVHTLFVVTRVLIFVLFRASKASPNGAILRRKLRENFKFEKNLASQACSRGRKNLENRACVAKNYFLPKFTMSNALSMFIRT